MGAARLGPLARLGDDGARTAAAMAAMATALPAALVFRARYRAFRAARVILGVALVGVAAGGGAPGAGGARRGRRRSASAGLAAIGVAAAVAATLGFMGPETSGGCAQWAALVVGAYAARPTVARRGARRGAGATQDMIALTATALGALVTSTLVMFALFQILAAALAGQAREVNVHRAVGPSASDPGPRFNSGFED